MILTDTDNKLMVAKEGRGQERNKLAVWDEQKQTTTYKTDKQRGPTVGHRARYSVYMASFCKYAFTGAQLCLPVAALCPIIRVVWL